MLIEEIFKWMLIVMLLAFMLPPSNRNKGRSIVSNKRLKIPPEPPTPKFPPEEGL